jgi:hypothetical protein
MSTTDELVTRLRDAHEAVALFPEERATGFNDLLALRNMVPDAADAIETLTRERDEARAEASKFEAQYCEALESKIRERLKAFHRITALEADKARLREALRYVDGEATAGIGYEAMLYYRKREDREDPDSVPTGLRSAGHIKMAMIREKARAVLEATP